MDAAHQNQISSWDISDILASFTMLLNIILNLCLQFYLRDTFSSPQHSEIKQRATSMNVRGIWNCDITKRQTHLGKLSIRKHFKSIFDSGSVKFSVSVISKEQCGCRSRDPAGEVEYNTEHYQERVHHTPPPVQTQYATIIHKHSNTSQSHAFHHNQSPHCKKYSS